MMSTGKLNALVQKTPFTSKFYYGNSTLPNKAIVHNEQATRSDSSTNVEKVDTELYCREKGTAAVNRRFHIYSLRRVFQQHYKEDMLSK